MRGNKKSKIEVNSSDIYGKGTFARVPIKQGEIVLSTQGDTVLAENIDVLVPAELFPYCFQIDTQVYLCPPQLERSKMHGIFLVNHSCNPNCGIINRTSLVAIRDISSGEEITFDYAMTDADPPGIESEIITCRCGSADCRKRITGEDWKLKKLQERYKGYFSKYLQDMIDKI